MHNSSVTNLCGHRPRTFFTFVLRNLGPQTRSGHSFVQIKYLFIIRVVPWDGPLRCSGAVTFLVQMLPAMVRLFWSGGVFLSREASPPRPPGTAVLRVFRGLKSTHHHRPVAAKFAAAGVWWCILFRPLHLVDCACFRAIAKHKTQRLPRSSQRPKVRREKAAANRTQGPGPALLYYRCP